MTVERRANRCQKPPGRPDHGSPATETYRPSGFGLPGKGGPSNRGRGGCVPDHLDRADARVSPVGLAREDVAVAESAVIGAVVIGPRNRGDHNQVGDVFICAECQADATQFIDIQDSIPSLS